MTLINPYKQDLEETDLLTDIENTCHLIVWNDNVNTLDWVIESLQKSLRALGGAG